jgi:NADH:ubiquinone oxidoreductase subunit F (NADH-binding)
LSAARKRAHGSIEGRRGNPDRTAFPVEKGIFQKPTIICNVETLAMFL